MSISEVKDFLSELNKLLKQMQETDSNLIVDWEELVSLALEGDEHAQHALSTALSTGVFADRIIPMDSLKALLLEYFSALSGNPLASMGMGYRFRHGLGVAASCERALSFYEYSANIAANKIEEDGYSTLPDRSRLPDLLDKNIVWSKAEATLEWTDYYSNLAENGDKIAAMLIGNIYATGNRLVPVDWNKAFYYLHIASKLNYVPSCGYLGYALARFHHQNKTSTLPIFDQISDFKSLNYILRLLRVGYKSADIQGTVGMGYVYLNGIGVEQNVTKAFELFQKTLYSHPDSGFHMGEYLMKVSQFPSSNSFERISEFANAFQAYSASAQLGNVLAQHRLGHLFMKGVGVQRSCEHATDYFHLVSERGQYMNYLNRGHYYFTQGDFDKALLAFSQLASAGIESAQFNAAYILSEYYCPKLILPTKETLAQQNSSYASSISEVKWGELNARFNNFESLPFDSQSQVQFSNITFPLYSHKSSINQECLSRALSLYGLSASQQNSHSFVLLGDFFYYGKANLSSQSSLAAIYYSKAADLKNTQAIFNMGIMHEIGDGVTQDFHLAKRYYDLAAEVDANARVPRDIALFLLESHKQYLFLANSSLLAPLGLPMRLDSIVLPQALIGMISLFASMINSFLAFERSINLSVFQLLKTTPSQPSFVPHNPQTVKISQTFFSFVNSLIKNSFSNELVTKKYDELVLLVCLIIFLLFLLVVKVIHRLFVRRILR